MGPVGVGLGICDSKSNILKILISKGLPSLYWWFSGPNLYEAQFSKPKNRIFARKQSMKHSLSLLLVPSLHKKRKIMIPRYRFGTKDLPTTLTGLLWGRNPNVYWKIPRPKKSTGANATFFWIFCWISRSQEPRGFFTWLKRSFSPKANTGTREALKNTERKVLLEDDTTSEWALRSS